MLIDDIEIHVAAGNGGDGKLSFRRNGQTAKGGPDGGNGGVGGNVYVRGVDDITALRIFRFKKSWKAEDGVPGGKNNLFGKKGNDLTLNIPIGTSIVDRKTNETFEVLEKNVDILIAKGGVGGRGNNEFKTATTQTPRFAEEGEKGQERELHLILRLIADIGLIGLPNVGKSSLLKALTNAAPKIGDYPFTTIEPNLGVMTSPNGNSPKGKKIVLADIPGLIKGASEGKGLGISFLKHIEKTKQLFHCIDSSSEDVSRDYEIVRTEFSNYSELLSQKKEIILLTKIDLISKELLDEKISYFKKKGKEVYTVSVYDEDSLALLKETLLSSL